MLAIAAIQVAPRPAAAQASDGARADSVALILEDVARTGVLNGLRWPRFPHHRDELRAIYSSSSWRAMWTVDGRPGAAAREGIDVLAAAEERGLHPEDYDAALLDRRFHELSAARMPSARDIAWFDIALSVGLMRHVSDVHNGRVNPKNISVGIEVTPNPLEVERVRAAIDGGRVADLVRGAEPQFHQYAELKAAYAIYRALAALPEGPRITASSAVRPGDRFEGAQAVRRRLATVGDLPAGDARTPPGADSAAYEPRLAAAVARFQERHGLGADSVIGPATLAALNVPLTRRLRQLELALERIRWLPALEDGPFVVVNVPSFALFAFDTVGRTGGPALTMRVVVGKDQVGQRTPLFEGRMQYLVFRPYWVIPRSILRKEILPAARRSHAYLTRNEMEIYSGAGDTGPSVATTSANLSRVARGELGIRQKPGPKNSLGLAKFIFPNADNVYFHGTPATELFARTRRDFSHGCIRLEDPARFATWVLRDSVQWSDTEVRRAMEDRTRIVNLERRLPVLIYYTTAVVRGDGTVQFLADLYGHDATLEAALAKGYPFDP